LLAVASLSWFVPRGRTGRRLAALACALGCVLVGNVLRIAGSIAVGLVYGKPSLVLFHDWVGSLFAFSYTLGGYLLMLFLLLPAGPGPAVHTIRAAPAAVAARGGRGAHRVSV
jgi:exosortase/archaeosortase family protein